MRQPKTRRTKIEDLRRQVQALQAFAGVSIAAIVGTTALLQAACQAACAGSGLTRAKAMRHDAAAQAVVVEAATGWQPDITGMVIPVHARSTLAPALQAQQPLVINDLPRDPRFDHEEPLRSQGIDALVNVPIRHAGTTWGVLEIDSDEPITLTDDDATFLQSLADLLAVALERVALEARLRAADARKDEFLATLGHELRNPLAPLRTVARLFQRSAVPPAQQRPLVDIIERQVGQLTRLVEDLLQASRIVHGKITLQCQLAPVTEAVQAAVEAVQPLVDARRQQLVLHLASRAVVRLDAARITQVATNLLANASKFTPAGGAIHLETRDAPDAVEITVRDTGVGIAPALLPHVFELFTQGATRPDGAVMDGLGIGLSLARRLVELHGGTLAVDSAGPGEGATFTVRLPQAASAADGR